MRGSMQQGCGIRWGWLLIRRRENFGLASTRETNSATTCLRTISPPSKTADSMDGRTATSATTSIRVRSEEHTSDSSHVSNSYAVFCLKKQKLQKYSL